MKKINTYLFACILLLNVTKHFAQQDVMYSMYIFDKMLINPAFTGSSNWVVGTAKYRQSFTGIAGQPTVQTFNFHAPIQKKHIGLGFKVVNEKIAITQNLNASVNASYHLNFAKGKLSFGLEAGIYNRKTDYQKLILLNKVDNSIPTNAASSLVPDAAYGLYYQKKQIYVGFSQYHLISSKFKTTAPTASQGKLKNNLYFLLGNVYNLNANFSLEPSLLLKYQGAAKPQLDINATVYYNDRFGLGVQYRTGDAVVAYLKANITESIHIAYSYDITLSKLSSFSKGAHEIILSYGFKLAPPAVQKEIHPRYYF